MNTKTQLHTTQRDFKKSDCGYKTNKMSTNKESGRGFQDKVVETTKQKGAWKKPHRPKPKVHEGMPQH
jgi:hypothetical protein